jgi:hypothetical protein
MERKDDNHAAGGKEEEEEEEDDLAERLAKRARHQHGRGGWQGSALELERPNPAGAASSIVDLEQFRNHQIGVGYQAKHVIRQPQSTATTTMATKSSSSKILSLVEDNNPREKTKDTLRQGGGERGASSSVRNKNSNDNDNNSNKYNNNKYLQHAGLRRLRKELEMYK